MLTTHRHYSCYVPTEHESLPLDQVAEFDQWMDDELVRLEQQFAEFVTEQSVSVGWPGDERGR